jgi:cell fate (sporulation/competence/biofilm development) regulator YlbF (YheA/YmcA/DUF963 family)
MNVYDKAHELARALQSSQEYQRLAEQKQRVDADPAAKKMLEDFRRRQWEMETQRLMGESISEGDEAAMQRLQEAVSLHPVLRDTLEAEYRFGIIYSDIHKIIDESVQGVIGKPEE